MLFSVQVGIIWSYCRKFRQIGGDLSLANLNSSITAVLERFGLSTVIKVGSSVDECIEFIPEKIEKTRMNHIMIQPGSRVHSNS